MDQVCARLASGFGHRTDRIGVDRMGQRLFALGAIDRGVGGGIDHDIGCAGLDRRADRRRIGKIELGAREAGRGPAFRHAFQQGPADLAARADNQRLHRSVLSHG